jgi:hypothetical protein
MTLLFLTIAAVSALALVSLRLTLLRRRPERQQIPVMAIEAVSVGSLPVWQDRARVCGLTLMEAEDLLDWLEQNGYQERQLQSEAGGAFVVEFRVDPEHPFMQGRRVPHRALVNLPDVAKVRH